MYPDGGGLYLQVANSNAKSWLFRYAIDGRDRYMGLGAAIPYRSTARGRRPVAAVRCDLMFSKALERAA